MSQTSITCKNCENQFTGHFCNNCGQRANLHRINFKYLLHEFFHALTHLDKGILYTAKKMLVEPGNTLRDYLYGKRIRHSNPFLMLVIIGGLCSLTYYHFELKLVSSFKISELDGGIHAIDSKFFAILYVFYSIILSVFDYLLFRYKGYNFTEFFTFNVFIATQILLMLLALVPLWLLGHHLGINAYLRLLVGASFLAYMIFVRYDFYEAKNSAKARNRMIIESLLFICIFVFMSLKTVAELLKN